MAPGAAEQESSANPLRKHQRASRGGRRGSAHSLFCQSTTSPGSPWGGAGLVPAPPRTLPGRGSTDQARSPRNGQCSSCPKPGVTDLLCHLRRRVRRQTAWVCCGHHQQGGQSTTELSSVGSQPAAFPRKGSAAEGGFCGAGDPPGGQQPLQKVLHIAPVNAGQ